MTTLTRLQADALREIIAAGCASVQALLYVGIGAPATAVSGLHAKGLIRPIGDPVGGEQLWEPTPAGWQADATGAA